MTLNDSAESSAPYCHPAPWDARIEPLTLPDMLWATAERVPGNIACDFYGARTSYAALAKAVRAAAGGFTALGLGRGERVGLFLPNCPQYIVAYYGALAAGAAVVNFSPLYSADELEHQARDAGVTTMVCLDAAQLFPTIRAVLDRGALARLIVGSVADALPPLKRLGFNMFRRKERAALPPSDPRFVRWGELMLGGPYRPCPVHPHDLALIQYTGGTTGRPKGAMLTHANLTANAQQVAAIEPEPGETHRVLGALPFFHVFANTGVLNSSVLRGNEIVILPKFSAAEALAAVKRRRITALPGVPAMFNALADAPGFAATDWSSLRIAVAGGAPMPIELQDRFESATGVRVAEGYGLTETSGVASANPYVGERRVGSIGQPIPRTRVMVVDREDPTRPAPPGEPGELTIEGPQVMQGYWGHEHDASAFVDGRLRTGDVGYIDDDGFLWIVDRLKDMINVGGFKVFPSRLEDVAYTHPAVAEALAIAVPDPRVGERPKLYVSLRPGAQASAEELMALVSATVGKHEKPVGVVIRDTLPKTLVGKLDRKALVALDRASA
jgi:long-chain acyl-CoA synthetase